MATNFINALSFAGDALCSKAARVAGIGTGRLQFAVVWITNRCNLRCLMCDQWKSSPHEAQLELTTGQWCSFIDSLKRMHARILVITGGEPLLRDDTPEIIRYASDKGISTHLCTNGTLLDECLIRRMRDSGLDSLSVSLDSADAATHNLIRGSVCYGQVVENIRALRSLAPSIKVGINCVINRHNLFGLHRLADFAICLGVNQLKFDLVHRNLKHRHKAPESMKTIMFNKQDESDVRKQVRNLKAALSTNCLLSNSTVYLNNIPSSISGRGACARLRCYCGYISCAVDSMGWVSACEHMTGTLNIADTPMEKYGRAKNFMPSAMRSAHVARNAGIVPMLK